MSPARCDEPFVHALEHRDDVRVFTEPDDGQSVTLHPGEVVEVRLPEIKDAGIKWRVVDVPGCLRAVGELYDGAGADFDAELDADPGERVFVFEVLRISDAGRLRLAAHQNDEDGEDGYVDGSFELDVRLHAKSAFATRVT